MRTMRAAVSQYLEKEYGQGNHWVSFPGQELPDVIDKLQGHKSAVVASRRCESLSFGGANVIYGKRHVPATYASIENLLREVAYQRRGLLPIIADLSTIDQSMEASRVSFIAGTSKEDQAARLALGDVVLVERSLQMVPYQQIGLYYVLTSQPMSQQAFGEGALKSRLLHRGKNLTGALDALLDARKWLCEQPNAAEISVRLVGSLRENILEYNQHGQPLRGTGIELSQTRWMGGTIHSTEVLDVYKQQAFPQQLFARYDKARSGLVLLSDQLQDVSRNRTYASYGSPIFRHTLLPDLLTAAKRHLFNQAAHQKRDKGEGHGPPAITP